MLVNSIELKTFSAFQIDDDYQNIHDLLYWKGMKKITECTCVKYDKDDMCKNRNVTQ